ncbi:MAG TPA: hypothetical protein VNR60_07205 [Croceibacterium sp.]|nr:hypothetical protein [Croceibacterium sp.]
MADLKPVASLGATLLARKGGARPAMRPQVAATGLGGAQAAQKIAADLEDLGWNDMGEDDTPEDRSAEVLQLTPAPANPESEARTDRGSPRPGVRSMHEELAARLAAEGDSDNLVRKNKAKAAPEAETEAKAAEPQPAAEIARLPLANKPQIRPEPEALSASDGRRAAFTLRLDAQRHLKLRLASTIRNRSAQQLVTEALDRFLRDIPEIELLARNIQQNDRKGA